MESKMTLEKMIAYETKKRLGEMEQPGYEFPKRITKIDVMVMVTGFGVSLLLIAMCMLGVIK